MHFVFLTKFPLSSLFSMLIVRSSSLTPLHAFFYSSSTKQFDCQDSGSILSILHFLLVAPSMLWFRLPVPDNNGGTALTFLAKRGAPIPFSDEIHFLYSRSSPTTLFLFRCFLLQLSPPLKLLTTTWVGAMNMTGIWSGFNSWDHKLNNVAFSASSCMLPYLFITVR